MGPIKNICGFRQCRTFEKIKIKQEIYSACPVLSAAPNFDQLETMPGRLPSVDM